MKFNTWFYELEGSKPRHEKIIDDLKQCVEKGETKRIMKWLKIAYEQGYNEAYSKGYGEGYEDGFVSSEERR